MIIYIVNSVTIQMINYVRNLLIQLLFAIS